MELDLERVRYLLKAYLRTRLEKVFHHGTIVTPDDKIEKYSRYISRTQESFQRLSVPEADFVKRLV